jgi:hypothetical protein
MESVLKGVQLKNLDGDGQHLQAKRVSQSGCVARTVSHSFNSQDDKRGESTKQYSLSQAPRLRNTSSTRGKDTGDPR